MDHAARIAFEGIDWVTVGPGVREKRVTRDTAVLRLVEFAPPFVEDGWCETGHTGFVVSGGFTLETRGGRTTDFEAGDGLVIPAGALGAHRAIVDRPVVLFLVEDAGAVDRYAG